MSYSLRLLVGLNVLLAARRLPSVPTAISTFEALRRRCAQDLVLVAIDDLELKVSKPQEALERQRSVTWL